MDCPLAHINPVWPNDGDPGWGDTLNANFNTMTSQINTHDDLIASIGAGTAPPAATTTSQGVVQLAGDLTGTATAPVLKAVTTAATVGSSSAIPVITFDAKGRITSASTVTSLATADATTSSKGNVQLAGDLSGTAAAPTLKAVIAPGTVGSSTQIPVLTYDTNGRIISVSTAPPSGSGGTASDAVSAGSYGLTADGLYGLTGSMTSGSAVLTFSTGGFTSAHVGATVRVNGAGASGAVLVTTIATFTNSTTVTLVTAASTTVSGTMVLAGHDNGTAVNNALIAATGKRLTFPKGVYYMSGSPTVPANTVLDGAGATFLYGGFAVSNFSTVERGTFIGDGSTNYYFAITAPSSGPDDVVIRNNYMLQHSWGVFYGQGTSQGSIQRWKVRDNVFDAMRNGSTYLSQMTDSIFDNNAAINVVAGTNSFNFDSYQQRNKITNNYVKGGRAAIIHLWTWGQIPAATATQTNDCYGNLIDGNVILNQTEEGISFDGGNSLDNATVASTNTGASTITLSAAAWATAGSKWQYYWVYFLTGANVSKMYRITAMSNATLTLEIAAGEMATIAAGDTVVIGAPFHHNRVTNNYIDGRSSSTFSIWLYSFSCYNVVANNTIDGASIGTASTNSMAAAAGSVTGTATSSPCSNNVFANNVVTCQSSVTTTYGNIPGISLMYVQYGGLTTFYTFGNVVTGNVVRNGTIVGQYNQKLTANNIADGGASFTNTPPSGGLSFV